MESPSRSRFLDIGPYPLDRSASLACATDLDNDQGALSYLKSLVPLPALKNSKTAEGNTCESGENIDDLFSTIDKYSALLEVLAGGPTSGGKETSAPLTHSLLSLLQSHPNMPVEYGIAPSEVWLDPFSTERTKEIPAAIDGRLAQSPGPHLLPDPMANFNFQKPAQSCTACTTTTTTVSLPPTPLSHYSLSPGPGHHDGSPELRSGKCRGRPVPTFHDLKAVGDEEKRPYVCKIKNCFKSFKRNEHCIRHAKDMHSPKPKLPCPAIGCTVEVKRKDNLYQHMRTHPFHMFPPGTKMPPALPKKLKKALQGRKDNSNKVATLDIPGVTATRSGSSRSTT